MTFSEIAESLKLYVENNDPNLTGATVMVSFDLERYTSDDPAVIITPNSTTYALASRQYLTQRLLLDVWYVQSLPTESDINMLNFIDDFTKLLFNHKYDGASVVAVTPSLHLSEHSTRQLFITQFTVEYSKHAGF